MVVPAVISRLGVFDYHAKELGINELGIKRVARTEKSLFSDETIASFENASLTVGHPKEGVNAKNWKTYAVGTVRNVKRVNDTLTAEAWIFDQEAIRIVQEEGISELSCGYDCDVLPSTLADADFEMSPMIGNHVAIVANGRCGGTVKLADKETTMSKSVKLLDAILGVFGVKLSDEQKKAVEEKEEEEGKKPETEPKKTEEKPQAVSSSEKNTKPNSEKPDKEEEKKKMADEALKKQLADAQAEIQRLKDEKAQTELASKTAQALADAKTVFPNVAFTDSDSVRQIHERAILDQKLHTAEELKTLSDEAVAGAYGVAKKLARTNVGEAVGRALMGDSTTTAPSLDFNKLYGG